MTPLIAAWWKPAAMAAMAVVIVMQHDGLVTARLKDKDYQARIYNLGRDVEERDAKIGEVAGREYADAGQNASTCATDISSSFERGVAFGRAISHAKSPTPTATGGQPVPRRVRDFSEAWAADAFRPAAEPAASGDLRTAGG